VSGALFVIRAPFALADGTVMRGYLTPPVQGNCALPTQQPIIITPAGQVIFLCGMVVPAAQRITESYTRLGKSSASGFFRSGSNQQYHCAERRFEVKFQVS
jgi:hypothetical protein